VSVLAIWSSVSAGSGLSAGFSTPGQGLDLPGAAGCGISPAARRLAPSRPVETGPLSGCGLSGRRLLGFRRINIRALQAELYVNRMHHKVHHGGPVPDILFDGL